MVDRTGAGRDRHSRRGMNPNRDFPFARDEMAGADRSPALPGLAFRPPCYRHVVLALCVLAMLVRPAAVQAEALDELSLERWAKLRETERYQLNIAEKYYREQNWKAALAEYEKFVSLYEKSEGAPYAQLKWSLCQVQLRKHNSAIRDGYQSVVDYWPNAAEAISAQYFMGRTYKEMGEVKKAKKAYGHLLESHPQHLASTMARVDLVEIARVEQDTPTCIKYLKELTFDTPRNPDTEWTCHNASLQLASLLFRQGGAAEGIDALATTFKAAELAPRVSQTAYDGLREQAQSADTRQLAADNADRIAQALMARQWTSENNEEQATLERSAWLAALDVYAAASAGEKFMATYNQAEQRFGVADTFLERLGGWQLDNEQGDAARVAYGRFKEVNRGLELIALSFRRERNAERAVETYRTLAAKDEKQSFRWLGESGFTYRELQQWDGAIEVFQDLTQRDSEGSARWLWELATTYKYASRLKEAINVFRQCENFPDNYGQMAECHRGLGEFDEAISLYRQIVAGHEPYAPWASLQIAYTREQAGQKEQAIKSFQHVCRKYPKSGEASQAHAHLQTDYKITTTLGGAADGEGE